MFKENQKIEDYSLYLTQATESAALACFHVMGRGDAHRADELAVSAMRKTFNQLSADIQIVIGEGERDQAPRLYTGERLGDKNSPLRLDVAVDPLEGTNLCAKALGGAISVMAVSKRGGLLKAPDIYMKKIASPPQAKDLIDLNASPRQNIERVAKALGKAPEKITVGLLDRPRHHQLIKEIREAKASARLVEDGDLGLALECTFEDSPIDLMMGTGGAPEGVLAAAALKCLGGGFQAQLLYKNNEERERAEKAGLSHLDKLWTRDELVSKEPLFVATGISSSSWINGIKKTGDSYLTHSLILSLRGRKELISEHKL